MCPWPDTTKSIKHFKNTFHDPCLRYKKYQICNFPQGSIYSVTRPIFPIERKEVGQK